MEREVCFASELIPYSHCNGTRVGRIDIYFACSCSRAPLPASSCGTVHLNMCPCIDTHHRVARYCWGLRRIECNCLVDGIGTFIAGQSHNKHYGIGTRLPVGMASGIFGTRIGSVAPEPVERFASANTVGVGAAYGSVARIGHIHCIVTP